MRASLALALLLIAHQAVAHEEAKCATLDEEVSNLLQTNAHVQKHVVQKEDPDTDESGWVTISRRFLDASVAQAPAQCGLWATQVVIKKDKLATRHGRKGSNKFCTHAEGPEYGRGSFGAVKAGYGDLPGGVKLNLALKFSDVGDPKSMRDLKNEVNVLVHLKKDTKHIVEIYGFNESKGMIAMEPLTGGSLRSFKDDHFPLGNGGAKKVMSSVISAVASCHLHHVAHRDIKEHQFVFTKKVDGDWGTPLKMVDFGTAHRLVRRRLNNPNPVDAWNTGIIGTWPYISPEVFYNKEVGRQKISGPMRKYSAYAPDVWAVGVIAFGVQTAKVLIDQLYWEWSPENKIAKRVTQTSTAAQNTLIHHCDDETIDKVLMREHPFYQGSTFTPAGDWLRKALKMDPNKRASADELMKHPWLTGGRDRSDAFSGDSPH